MPPIRGLGGCWGQRRSCCSTAYTDTKTARPSLTAPFQEVVERLIEDVEAGIAGVQLLIVVHHGLPVGVDSVADERRIVDDAIRELR